jgi:chromosome segregation protein
MSRIKELRLHGFKTFAEPTRFVFGRGVTAVIGPNGSGKSNMADAVRWVLGEQSNRSLRTRRADDVIFAGSDARRPQGMAEVLLTLDNSDRWLPVEFLEVTIGRRAYRSGETEYLLNGAPTRRRDLVDLLAAGRLGANELVVVGQGTVDAALSLRPEERRQLFEEAAGVKRLQVRKNEALARLAGARDNLARVADLVDELKPQVRRLALQAQHQQEHDSLGARARSLAEEFLRRREMVARSAMSEARRRLDAAEVELGRLHAEDEAEGGAVAAAEQRYRVAEEAVGTASAEAERLRESRIRAEARAEALGSRITDLEAAVTHGGEELAAAERALAAHQGDESGGQMGPLLAEAAAAEVRWKLATAGLAAADSALVDAENALADARHRESGRIAGTARRNELLARQRARLESVEMDLRNAESAHAASLAELETATGAATAAAAEMAILEQRAIEASGAADRARAEAESARNRAADLAARIGTLQAELDALREQTEQTEQGGRRLGSLLAAAGWRSLIDFLDPPLEAWPAIEAVVGGELDQALLWHDGELVGRLAEARGAVRLLTAEDGAAPPDVDGRAAALTAVGGTQTLAEWIGAPNGPRIFARAVVAPDAHALLNGWRRLPAGWSAVTTHGDLADSRGLVAVRGRQEADGGVAARRHARRREVAEALTVLESKHEGATAAAAAAAAELVAARHRQDEIDRQGDEARRRSRQARSSVDGIGGALARLERELVDLASNRSRTLVAEHEAAETSADGSGQTDDLARLQAAAESARRERDTGATHREAARAAWLDARTVADEVESRSAGLRGGRAALEATAAHLRGLQPRQLESLAEAKAELSAVETEVAGAREADHRSRAALDQTVAERDLLRADLLARERARSAGGSRRLELERASQAAAMDLSRAEEVLVALARERELTMEQLAGPSDAPPGPGSGSDEFALLDAPVLETELRSVRRTLAALGSVNPFAVEEHRELATRLEGVTTQQADLTAATRSTLELIERMETEIATTFDAAFNAIAVRFNDFCRLLFAGGSASLEKVDQTEADGGGGIEIVVQPPGKRAQRLAMLSGGERALTGVALLFAMLSVHPVPFCILDEVDAALDEANIGRFAEALRALSRETDFVVVTHNRATIEVADTIYGVTMTDAAVSRVLSLQLAELPAESLVG